MIMYLTEDQALKLATKLKNPVLLSTDRSVKGVDIQGLGTIKYRYPEELYPSQDEQCGYLRGDISFKKIVKHMRKKIMDLDPDEETANFQLTFTTFLQIIENGANGGKNCCPIIFIHPTEYEKTSDGKSVPKNPDMIKRNKMIKKYLKALFKEVGVKIVTKYKKSLVKGSIKKVRDKFAKMCIKDGIDSQGRFHLLMQRSLHRATMCDSRLDTFDITDPDDIGGKLYKSILRDAFNAISGEYIGYAIDQVESWPSKKFEKKAIKMMIKGAKKNVKYYDEYREMINGMKLAADKKGKKLVKLPKMKLTPGYDVMTEPEEDNFKSEKKYKKAKKMYKTYMKRVKAFVKFFKKTKNFGFLQGFVGHVHLRSRGLEIGEKNYVSSMESRHKLVPDEGFAKRFSSLAKTVKKSVDDSAKAKQEAAAA